MQIAVMSDSHDNLENLKKAIKYIESQRIENIIFCGDFCSPIPVKLIFANFKGKIHAVFGNTEDRYTITKLVYTEIQNLILYGEHAEIELDNKKFGVTHYPLYAEAMAKTGSYDAVFYGHTHEAKSQIIDKCLLLNPGEIMGFNEIPRFAIYDTEINSAEFTFIKDL